MLLRKESHNGTAEKMALQVKLEVQPGEAVRFPPLCVNCGRRAEGAMRLRKRRGRVTREIEAPLCEACRRELQRLSGDEERWLRMGWFFGGVALLLGLILFMVLLPGWLSFMPRLILSLLLGGMVGAGVLLAFRRKSETLARPEKQAVRNAARLRAFSWRATTLEFEDEVYGQQFVDLNRDKLLEIQKV